MSPTIEALLLLFCLKLIDSILSAAKNIFVIRNRFFLSSLFSAVSAYFYFVMVVRLAQSTDQWSILAICFAVFLGNHVTYIALEKFRKDSIFVFEIYPCSLAEAKDLADELREHDLPVRTYKSYTDDMKKTLCIKVYSESRAQSKLIESMIPESCVYNVIEPRIAYL